VFAEPVPSRAATRGLALSLLLHAAAFAALVSLVAVEARHIPAPTIPVTLLREEPPEIVPAAPAPPVARAPIAVAPPTPRPRLVPRPTPRAAKPVAPPANVLPAPTLVVEPAPLSETPAEVPIVDPLIARAAPAGASTARDALRVFGEGEVDRRARALEQPHPSYPARARMLGKEADRKLLVTVAANGGVLDVVVEQGTGDEFDREAVAGVRRWRFEPAQRAGAPVASRVQVTVRFRLDR
jgi:protein TonB